MATISSGLDGYFCCFGPNMKCSCSVSGDGEVTVTTGLDRCFFVICAKNYRCQTVNEYFVRPFAVRLCTNG